MGSSPTSGILKKSAIIIASKTRPSSARGNIKKNGVWPCAGRSVRDGGRVSCLRRWFVILLLAAHWHLHAHCGFGAMCALCGLHVLSPSCCVEIGRAHV